MSRYGGASLSSSSSRSNGTGSAVVVEIPTVNSTAQFVNQSAIEHLECPICTNVVNDPVQCVKGHLHCRSCFEQAIELTKKCPTCKVKIADELITSLAVQKLINASAVYCYTRVSALESAAAGAGAVNKGSSCNSGTSSSDSSSSSGVTATATVTAAETSGLVSITARGRASWQTPRIISKCVITLVSSARILVVTRWWLAETWPSTRRLVCIAPSDAGCVGSKRRKPSSHSTSLFV
jgi:hypothetical protein